MNGPSGEAWGKMGQGWAENGGEWGHPDLRSRFSRTTCFQRPTQLAKQATQIVRRRPVPKRKKKARPGLA
jgi:hypothetical protein